MRIFQNTRNQWIAWVVMVAAACGFIACAYFALTAHDPDAISWPYFTGATVLALIVMIGVGIVAASTRRR